MPQMAPMMWQVMYMSCIVLMMISISKNFFSSIYMKKLESSISKNNEEMTWKW